MFDITDSSFEHLIDREWLISNGLGGSASSTICGMNTRKYHGLLVAALAPPVRRMVILSRVDETVITSIGAIPLSTNEYPGTIYPQGYTKLRAFNLDPFPRWAYQCAEFTLEKSLRLLPGENTVCLSYSLLGGARWVELELRPLLALRKIHELMYQWGGQMQMEAIDACRLRIAATGRTPEIFLAHDGEFTAAPVWYLNTIYRREQERGYGGLEDLWMPGVIRRALSPGQTLHFTCSTEPVDCGGAFSRSTLSLRAGTNPAVHHDATLDELSAAAKLFCVQMVGCDDKGRWPVVMSHYPWSPPSIRGALIAMAGIFLAPGLPERAKSMLDGLTQCLDKGVMPTLIPEDGSGPVLQGADVSLWFINAVWQYFRCTGDETGVRVWLPVMRQIIHHYRAGTHLGIAADSDGLIRSTAPGMPTTWMDAKFNDWVVTQRPGMPVELNALWYNALCIVADLEQQSGDLAGAAELTTLSARVKEAFNRRYWNIERNALYDVIDAQSADGSIRPNQIFAVALPFAVLAREHQADVLDRVINDLLTPYGLRTLAPREPGYQGNYVGNVMSRDRAYHQGSAFPWLLGPLVCALVKVRGRTPETMQMARQMLQPSITYLLGDGLGKISELFDGDAPHRPGGATASALAVGEIARCWAEHLSPLPSNLSAAMDSSKTPVPSSAV